MNYAVFQPKRSERDLRFAPLPSDGELFVPIFDPERYDKVYEGSFTSEQEQAENLINVHAMLERIFVMLNSRHPAGYMGTSLSTGDIVRIGGVHFCCTAIG